MFWLWSRTAGRHDPARVHAIAHLQDIAFTTKDDRTLRGYQLQAQRPANQTLTPEGYLLVAQGNGMLAEHIIDSFQDVAEAGYDVFVFDYRGYGRSEGRPRLQAILSDYRDIIDHLDSLAYDRRRFYGMSFGGIVLLDALQGRMQSARVVIDSTPSRLSDYGCPQSHDPVANLPQECADMLFIVGGQDTVVPPAMSEALVDLAAGCGASILVGAGLAHPFMDREISQRLRRMQTVKSFLLE